MFLAVAFALFAPLQAPSAPPDPAADAPPVVELKPAAPPETATPEATDPTKKKKKREPVDRGPVGLDTVPTAAIQLGAGTGACCVSACCCAVPLAFVPFVGGIIGNAVVGTAVGATETFVGDAAGQKRGPMLWPILGGAGVLVAGGVAGLVATLALGLGTPDPNNPGAYLAKATVPIAIGLVTDVAAVTVPVIIYQMTAVPKEPGDEGGMSMPGLVEPADPTGTRADAAKKQHDDAENAHDAKSNSNEPPPGAVPY